MVSIATDLVPFFLEGGNVTTRVEAAIIGKRVAAISGPLEDDLALISPAGAGDVPFGVAARDGAIGDDLLVVREGVLPITAGGAITAGQAVKPAAGGKVVPVTDAGDIACGFALDDAANNEDAVIAWLVHVHSGGAATVVGDQAAVADIATADANDLASAIALANANKAKINTILARLRTAGIIVP